jgi:hypothetical protein
MSEDSFEDFEMPGEDDPPEPPKKPRRDLLAGWTPAQRQLFLVISVAIVLIGMGAALGLWLAPESPAETAAQVTQLEAEIETQKQKIGELERALKYQATDKPVEIGRLTDEERRRHEREGRRYVAALRRVKAQGAAELMEWFVHRWVQLLDQPQPDDRVGRRAATLSLLVGGMAANLNPGDYVPWQAEFFNSKWLAELHYDIDRDGLPGKRSAPNARDGFANVSVCHIAMAINQAVSDAQVLVMPDMRCDRADARMSVFLQGTTWDDAITEFVQAVKQHGFVVVERLDKGVRLVLIGTGKRPKAQDEE